MELVAESSRDLEISEQKNSGQLSSGALDLFMEELGQVKKDLRTISILPGLTLTPEARRPAPVSNNPNLAMGNPSAATTDASNANNYLLVKDQYVMSYNRDFKTPNWVSWQLDTDWLGSSGRTGAFSPDESLPASFPRATPGDYKGSGFDRGHNVPSGDRTRSREDNEATFQMSNIAPQTPDNNQGPWEKLESYARDLAKQGKELYIIAGRDGKRGEIGDGVSVPGDFWKVIVVLPQKGMGVSDVNANTQVIAVEMPNVNGIRNDDWRKYITTVDEIERQTGFDLLSNLPDNIENSVEAKRFGN